MPAFRTELNLVEQHKEIHKGYGTFLRLPKLCCAYRLLLDLQSLLANAMRQAESIPSLP